MKLKKSLLNTPYRPVGFIETESKSVLWMTLIRECPEDSFMVTLFHFSRPIECLGFTIPFGDTL